MRPGTFPCEVLMRQVRFVSAFVAALLVVPAWSGTAGAADKEPVHKFKAEVHPHGKEAKKVAFDVKKKEDLETLIQHIRAAELEHLEADTRRPNPMAIAVDLGVSAIVIFVLLLLIL